MKKMERVFGLLVIVMLISGCSGPKTATANAVEIKGFSFNPAAMTVSKGTAVTWVQKDSASHTVTTTGAPVDFDSGRMNQEDTFSQTFDIAGAYEYYCSIHPSMRAKIIVTG